MLRFLFLKFGALVQDGNPGVLRAAGAETLSLVVT